MSSSQGLGAKSKSTKQADDRYKTMRTMLTVFDELRAGKRFTTNELMRRFEVEKAAALRYKRLLADQIAVRFRVQGGRKVVEQQPPNDPIARAAAVELALAMVPWLRGTTFHQQLAALAQELRGGLSADDQDKLDRLINSFYVKRRDPPRSAHFAKVIERSIEAIRQRQRCRITYTKLNDSTNDYLIEPWFLALVDGVLFLRAAKQPGTERRLFELSGVHRMEVLEERFAPPPRPQQDPHTTFQHTVGTYTSDDREPTQVELLVRDRARVLLNRRPLHGTQTMGEPDADGWSRVQAQIALCPELIAEILAMLPNVRVLSPPELRREVREAAGATQGSAWDP